MLGPNNGGLNSSAIRTTRTNISKAPESAKKRDVKADTKQKEKYLKVPHQEVSDATSNISTAPKKRGRKREKDDTYFNKAMDKINEIKAKLRTAKADGMDVKER